MNSMKRYVCRICGNTEGNSSYEIREMMLGLREPFTYFLCANCGCFQIAEIPKDLISYYPPDYYSFCSQCPFGVLSLKRRLGHARDRYAVFRKGLFGRILHTLFPNELLSLFSRVPLTLESRILDIGCGQGTLLRHLESLGFRRLTGADPYIACSVRLSNAVEIVKSEIETLIGEWDLVMMHHSFEHMSDPFKVLFQLKKILSKQGVCLIRIPMIDSWAWRNYGVDFAQIDAPRHLFLHSRKSMGMLAAQTGFRIDEMVEESSLFQFWASEQYRRGISLNAADSYGRNPEGSIFTKAEIASFRKRAKELRKRGVGDQRAFFLSQV